MVVHRKNIGASYWSENEGDLTLANLCSYESKFFTVNPETIDVLLGDKDSVFSQSTLDSNFTLVTSSDITVTAADFADTNWGAKGWTVDDEEVFYSELENFIQENYSQTSINPGAFDTVIILTRGTIGGVDYSIPIIFFGNIGDATTDEFTSLLLHLDGDGTDSSQFNHTPTNVSVTFDTGKFGQAGVFSAGSSRFTYPSGLAGGPFDLAGEDWTMEVQIYFTALGAIQHFFNRWESDWYWLMLNSNTMRWSCPSIGITWDTTVSISTLTWHHLAVCRSGGTLYAFVNGTQVGTTAISNPLPFTPSVPVGVGAIAIVNPNIDKFTGRLDEVRLTKGLARYTSSFTPPAAPFI